MLVLGHDHLRRPAPDRVRVDPRDDQRDQHDPAQRLEVGEEGEPDEGDAEELAEVLRRVPAGDVERPGEHAETDADRDQAASALQRQHQPHEPEARRHHDERDECDVPPRRRVPQTVVERVVEGERREES